jgi:hypothetical protein
LEVLPVQLIQQFTSQDVSHWRARWIAAGLEPDWILGSLVYHEACGILLPGHRIRIWDPTDNLWLREGNPGYSGTLAVRVVCPSPSLPETLQWGRHDLRLNKWVKVV